MKRIIFSLCIDIKIEFIIFAFNFSFGCFYVNGYIILNIIDTYNIKFNIIYYSSSVIYVYSNFNVEKNLKIDNIFSIDLNI